MTLVKLKVAHIHTDYKFVHSSDYFLNNYFENKTIIIQNNTPYVSQNKSNEFLFSKKDEDIKKIINFIKDNDVVVLYNLDSIKVKIALALPSEQKIIWRFFGIELYQWMPKYIYSKLTKKALGQTLLNNFFQLFIHPRSELNKRFIKKEQKLFFEAVKKIDIFLGTNYEEYEYLQEKFKNKLPQFIGTPFNTEIKINYEITKNKEEVYLILGNNRSPFNNHLDIISMLISNDHKLKENKIKVYLLFNYGAENSYSNQVRQAALKSKNTSLIETFMDKERFNQFYSQSHALIINGYRQMAGKNILTAFENGLKVYLSPKNKFYDFYTNEGFVVHQINELENDLKSNNCVAHKDEINNNLNALKELGKNRSAEAFSREVYDHLQSCKTDI